MIDTMTTAGKIEVMQAHESGKKIEIRKAASEEPWAENTLIRDLVWDWLFTDYRIKPLTVEEAAKEYSKSKYPKCADHVDIRTDFKAGAKWQKELDNE